MPSRTRLLIAWAGSSALVLPAVALAQTAAVPASAGAGAGDTADIVVTAQKRDESIQSVPISIQALGERRLDELQVRNLQDYVQFLPSVSFARGSTGVPGNVSTSFRGIATDAGLVDGLTYRANATYKFDRDHLVYGTVWSGFRPGGINRGGAAAAFDADKLTNYEIGTKNSFLDRRVTLNVTAFWEDWKDAQVTYAPPGSFGVAVITNAGGARSRGIEGDVSWRDPSGSRLPPTRPTSMRS